MRRISRQREASVLAEAVGMRSSALRIDAGKPSAAQVEIVIPVTSGQRDLALSVTRLQSFLAAPCPFTARVTIADGGGGEGAWTTATRLAAAFPKVSAIRAGARGRGPALRTAWARSQCDVLAYLDTDLLIDLSAPVPLVGPL